jgi:hypothetical protein
MINVLKHLLDPSRHQPPQSSPSSPEPSTLLSPEFITHLNITAEFRKTQAAARKTEIDLIKSNLINTISPAKLTWEIDIKREILLIDFDDTLMYYPCCPL